MTITFVVPEPMQPIGTGFPFTVSSDFIGPLETGASWVVQLRGGGDFDQILTTQSFGATTTSVTSQIFGSPVWLGIPVANSQVPIGSTIRMRVVLQEPTSGVIDDDTQDQVYDPVQGALWQLGATLRQLQADTPTSTELEVIQQAVAPSIPGLGSLGTVGQLLTGIPMGLLRRTLITPDRTGEGDLDFPLFGLGVAAFGLTWDVVSIPEGYGIQQGAPDYWSRVIVKLGLVHTDFDSHAFISTTEQFNDGNRYWMFNPMLPTRVLYWIAPGVVVRFYWLTP